MWIHIPMWLVWLVGVPVGLYLAFVGALLLLGVAEWRHDAGVRRALERTTVRFPAEEWRAHQSASDASAGDSA